MLYRDFMGICRYVQGLEFVVTLWQPCATSGLGNPLMKGYGGAIMGLVRVCDMLPYSRLPQSTKQQKQLCPNPSFIVQVLGFTVPTYKSRNAIGRLLGI